VRVFAVAEHRFGRINPISFELLNLANMVKGDGTSEAVVLAGDASAFSRELARYADRVWAISCDQLERYNPEAYVDVLLQVFRREKPDLVLLGNTIQGGEVAPCLAVSLQAPIATDVVGLRLDDGEVVASRYAYQGKIMVDLRLKRLPSILTVRQGVFKDGREVDGEVVELNLKPSREPKRRFVKYIEPETGDVDISQADVIVAVGRGIGGESNLKLAEKLARLLGGVVAGSRPVVDAGLLPKDRQVGISGKTVKPKVYLAFGISGAFQHVMGMKDSELIIAVNRDSEAPIFGVAHYGAVADLLDVLPALISKLEELKA